MKNTTSVISVEKVGPAAYNVTAYNGSSMGEFLMKEDGYYAFWPDHREGYWPAYMLRALADKLDELNKEWDESTQQFFDSLYAEPKEG